MSKKVFEEKNLENNFGDNNHNKNALNSHNSAGLESSQLENVNDHTDSNSHEEHSPLTQFEVKKIIDIKIGKYDLSFTNSALYMVIATFLIIAFMIFSTRKKSLIPSRIQTIAEILFNFINDLIKGSIGDEGQKFFPLIFSLFTFILTCNFLGMTPYGFTSTSQVAVTLSIAILCFFIITIYAIYRNKLSGFIHMFLPSGVPWWMSPVIFIIELFSITIIKKY